MVSGISTSASTSQDRETGTRFTFPLKQPKEGQKIWKNGCLTQWHRTIEDSDPWEKIRTANQENPITALVYCHEFPGYGAGKETEGGKETEWSLWVETADSPRRPRQLEVTGQSIRQKRVVQGERGPQRPVEGPLPAFSKILLNMRVRKLPRLGKEPLERIRVDGAWCTHALGWEQSLFPWPE